jgi:rubrerythrin
MSFIITDDMKEIMEKAAVMYGFSKDDEMFGEAFMIGWNEGAKTNFTWHCAKCGNEWPREYYDEVKPKCPKCERVCRIQV